MEEVDSDEECLESLFQVRDPKKEVFYFRGIEIHVCTTEDHVNDSLEIKYLYNFADEVDIFAIQHFHCTIMSSTVDDLYPYIFSIGMCLLPWYWMGYATNDIVVECAHLTPEMIGFWQTLYTNVLLEFKYVHKLASDTCACRLVCPMTVVESQDIAYNISLVFGRLVSEISQVEHAFIPSYSYPPLPNLFSHNQVLCPLGGGKDSLVVWQMINDRNKQPVFMYCADGLFEFEGSERLQKIVELSRCKVIIVRHVLQCEIFQRTAKSFYYPCGHPWAALCLFNGAMVCRLTGIKELLLGHERSANEGNGMMWDGIEVNHQYDKSSVFVTLAQNYLAKFVFRNLPQDLDNENQSLMVSSALSDLWETQIARVFCTCPNLRKFHQWFLSCNESALAFIDKVDPESLKLRDSWCCRCEKCCFVNLLMSAWLPPVSVFAVSELHPTICDSSKLGPIFPTNMMQDATLLPIFRSLVRSKLSNVSSVLASEVDSNEPAAENASLDSSCKYFKPFECIGTVSEACFSIEMAVIQWWLAYRGSISLPIVLSVLCGELRIDVEHLYRSVARLSPEISANLSFSDSIVMELLIKYDLID